MCPMAMSITRNLHRVAIPARKIVDPPRISTTRDPSASMPGIKPSNTPDRGRAAVIEISRPMRMRENRAAKVLPLTSSLACS
jgi:hypothetical protein